MSIDDRYRGRGILRGSGLYLSASVALDYVNDCVNENLAVLGIEGFLLKGDALHARTDLICDFSPLRPYLSWDEHRAQVNHTALTFLNHVTNNEHFVFQMQVITFEEWSNKGYGA